MHGHHREDRQKWHMWPGPSKRPRNGTEADSACVNFFFKAGRKIGIGDCAFFRPDSASLLIGLIKNFLAEDEGNLKLSVNWLYRLGDINLGKGASLEAAPNEIFYSFHKDEISAASLLHPCKVAFLQKGVELPSSVSSFVCRRVYDTANKCLYWLTDQDYTDEHQVEVDQLLVRTKHEMQAAAPSEGSAQRAARSPSPLKPETASAPLVIQGKGKKRPRSDQSQDASKREKFVKVEGSDARRDCALKYEDFAKVADKHEGIANVFCMEQLFQVMLQECSDQVKKLAEIMLRRTLLASIIAATEKEECLTHFVQLGGLRVLNDWLQEAHEGKLRDGSPKESDTVSEEFLLTLIRALEKLPVDLDALKNCIVGKSVNKLRSHRNPEIQKKARKLVDTWKKRVNAEMKSSDEVKSGASMVTTWPSKAMTETHIPKLRIAKNSTFVKSAMNGSNLGSDTKISVQPASGHKLHSGLAVPKENLAIVKEERSCSSGQSQNNSQSWCSGSGKGAGSLKEDARSPCVTPLGNKATGAVLRNPAHSSKSHSTMTATNLQKDFAGKHKSHGLERMSSASFLEKGATDGVRCENLTNHRLIVRLPNPGRSPHGINAGSLADGSPVNNKGSPPSSLGRLDHANESRAARNHSPGMVGEAKSVKCNGTSGSDTKEEVDRSCGSKNEAASKPTSFEHKPKDLAGKCPSDVHEITVRKAPSSTHASPSRLVLDSAEGGIDLLASVAAREVLECERNCSGSSAGERQQLISADSTLHSESIQHKDEKQNQSASSTCPLEPAADYRQDGGAVQEIAKLADHPKCEATSLSEEKAPEDRASFVGTEAGSVGNVVAKDVICTEPLDSQAVGCEALISGDSDDHILISKEERKIWSTNGGSYASGDCQTASHSGSLHQTTTVEHPTTPSEADDKAVTLGAANSPSICPNVSDSFAYFGEDALEVARQVAKEVEEEVERYEAQDANIGNDRVRCEKGVEHAKPNHMLSKNSSASMKDGKSMGKALDGTEAGICTSTLTERVEATEKGKCLSSKAMEAEQVPSPYEKGKQLDVMGTSKDASIVKKNASSVGAQEESATSTDVAIAEQDTSMSGKSPLLSEDNLCGSKEVERPVFDLNEGLVSDEAHLNSSLQIPASISPDPSFGVTVQANSLAAPIAVVAASKGPFLPPSNPTKSKGELGWKGSAATSAFRPAEPRRAAESSSHPQMDGLAATSGSVDVSAQSEKPARLLDIDLNVADERLIEDTCIVARPPVPASNGAPMASSGSGASRPELDLNRLDENDETVGHTTLVSREAGLPPPGSMLPQAAPRVMLDFDLNDGLGFEEAPTEEVLSHCSNPESSGRSITGRIQQNSDQVNVAPWYSTTSFTPAPMVMPAFPAGRSGPSYPGVAAPGSKSFIAGGLNPVPFSNDLYRGAAISSSAVSYSAAMPASFSYAGFPFGASFPYTSASYNMGSTTHIASTNVPPFLTANPSQLVSAGAMVSSYGRPYIMGGVRDLSGADANVSWVRSSLDLNSGPEVVVDVDARGDMRSSMGRSQLSYQQAASLNGTLKRKEPEGSYDPFRAGFRPMAWR